MGIMHVVANQVPPGRKDAKDRKDEKDYWIVGLGGFWSFMSFASFQRIANVTPLRKLQLRPWSTENADNLR